jgi:hypothetical protein
MRVGDNLGNIYNSKYFLIIETMSEIQQLGGTRQCSPIEDEMSYPLTIDEYLLIKENLSIEKFSNWESFLLSTGITTLISVIIIWITGSFEHKVIEGGKEIVKINISQIIIVVIYCALALGSILGLIISLSAKRKSRKVIQRLDVKITNHLKIS